MGIKKFILGNKFKIFEEINLKSWENNLKFWGKKIEKIEQKN